MVRFRRYRVFVACGVIFVFLLYRVSVNSAWDNDLQSQYRYVASAVLPNHVPQDVDQKPIKLPPSLDELGEQEEDRFPDRMSSSNTGDTLAQAVPPPVPEAPSKDDAPATTPPPLVQVPDRAPGVIDDVFLPAAQDPLQIQKPPSRLDPTTTFTPPIHWTKMPDRFPVDEASVIPLPTGKLVSIPRIQHKFEAETAEAKELREKRLAEVKVEMQRAWASYSKYAFGHDELAPLSKEPRDPFGGWGATLVDTMDTLWIMGLLEEFNEAYRGLSDIDFTTCMRNDIPVFETTIRYLGGLIAAYDVTGGKKGEYPLLLTKAVELAEVLMGVFDTPNRMPVLYYNWKPAFVSQPHRASTRAGVAELGTLSMEFTRLAQLTGENRYYDAVARITNALDEWSNREDDSAPLLAGIFPENIDASGCNKTATTLLYEDSPSPKAKEQVDSFTPGEPKGYVSQKPLSVQEEARDAAGNLKADASPPSTIGKRSIEPRAPPPGPGSTHWSSTVSQTSAQEPLRADGLPANWECVAQNLTAAAGSQSYGMGGSQDSAYEYFPKQYLLLGGLDATYRSLHQNTVEAVKKYLLFRPLAPDNPDILFSAKAVVSTDQTVGLEQRIRREYEVTHLTCFLGGMFAMGGKIFESEEDLDIGRRLTDGCVWAYSSMPSGIMAEYAQVARCQSMDSCTWNEAEWWLGIDPDPEYREIEAKAYLVRLAEWEEKKFTILRAEAERLQAEEELGREFSSVDDTESRPLGSVSRQSEAAALDAASHTKVGGPRRDDDSQSRPIKQKRTIDPETGDTLAFDASTLDQDAIEKKVKMLDDAYEHPVLPPPPEDSFGGTAGQIPIEQTGASPHTLKPSLIAMIATKPHQPQTHEEFVMDRITIDSLPKGYTKIGSASYQLRPEAIESVWYMYRITGDPNWQEKGWKMWKAIIANVKTDVAHSAINGVATEAGVTFADKMESFWTAETLKYFYLLYSEPDVVSLDEWVLNTEAHPFKRPI